VVFTIPNELRTPSNAAIVRHLAEASPSAHSDVADELQRALRGVLRTKFVCPDPSAYAWVAAEHVAEFHVVAHPVRHEAARDALDRELQAVRPRRTRRDGVRARDLLAPDGHLQGHELAGLEREQKRRQPHEAERLRVVRFLDDVGDAQLDGPFLPDRDVLVAIDEVLQQRTRRRRRLDGSRRSCGGLTAHRGADQRRTRSQPELQSIVAQHRGGLRAELDRPVDLDLLSVDPGPVGTLVHQEPAITILLEDGVDAGQRRVLELQTGTGAAADDHARRQRNFLDELVVAVDENGVLRGIHALRDLPFRGGSPGESSIPARANARQRRNS
jgi:hypothetical protein